MMETTCTQEVTLDRAIGFTVVAEPKATYTVSPTFTQYPNIIFDTLSSEGLPLTAYLSPAEGAILNRCVREANGWHRNNFRMSLSEMAKLTGLSKQGVINCIASLSLSGLISYNPNNGVGIWTLDLSDIESALEYYVSQHRSTELTVNKKKHRSTEFTKPSTEFTDNDQSGQLSLPPSIKEITTKKRIKEIQIHGENVSPNSINEKLQNEINALKAELETLKQPKPKKTPRAPKPMVDAEKSQAMASALNLNLDLKSTKRDITAAIRDLEQLYPDDTAPANITRVCNHLKSPTFNPPPSFVVKQWRAAIIALESHPVAPVAELSAEVMAVMANIKSVCLEPLTGWGEKDNALAQALAERVIAKGWQKHVMGFTWWGEGKPSLEVFKKGFSEYVSKKETHHASNQPNNDHFAVPTEGKLARATRTRVDM